MLTIPQDWSTLDNAQLKFALDYHSLLKTDQEYHILFEIQQRILEHRWLDVDKPPSPTVNLSPIGYFLSWWGMLEAGGGANRSKQMRIKTFLLTLVVLIPLFTCGALAMTLARMATR